MVVVLIGAVALSVVSWFVTGYHVVGRELRIYDGLVWRRTRAIPLERLQAVEASFEPLPFDAAAARAFGGVAASLRRTGRKPSARAFDALIAATAMANDLGVYTCNPRDFEGIDGLTVVAIPHPDRPS